MPTIGLSGASRGTMGSGRCEYRCPGEATVLARRLRWPLPGGQTAVFAGKSGAAVGWQVAAWRGVLMIFDNFDAAYLQKSITGCYDESNG